MTVFRPGWLYHVYNHLMSTHCLLGHERVYLPLYKVADTPFHIQGEEMMCMLIQRNTGQVKKQCFLICNTIYDYIVRIYEKEL